MNSKEGRQQLDRIQTHHANMLVQNHLSNPVGPPQLMTHQQLSMAAQEQLAPLQQQEQMIQSYQMPNLQINPQLNPQLQAQMRLSQLAQANLARQPNAIQAQALARAQQAQNIMQPPSMEPLAQVSAPKAPSTNPRRDIPADKVAQFKANLAKIAVMSEQQREQCFQQVSAGSRG